MNKYVMTLTIMDNDTVIFDSFVFRQRHPGYSHMNNEEACRAWKRAGRRVGLDAGHTFDIKQLCTLYDSGDTEDLFGKGAAYKLPRPPTPCTYLIALGVTECGDAYLAPELITYLERSGATCHLVENTSAGAGNLEHGGDPFMFNAIYRACAPRILICIGWHWCFNIVIPPPGCRVVLWARQIHRSDSMPRSLSALTLAPSDSPPNSAAPFIMRWPTLKGIIFNPGTIRVVASEKAQGEAQGQNRYKCISRVQFESWAFKHRTILFQWLGGLEEKMIDNLSLCPPHQARSVLRKADYYLDAESPDCVPVRAIKALSMGVFVISRSDNSWWGGGELHSIINGVKLLSLVSWPPSSQCFRNLHKNAKHTEDIERARAYVFRVFGTPSDSFIRAIQLKVSPLKGDITDETRPTDEDPPDRTQ